MRPRIAIAALVVGLLASDGLAAPFLEYLFTGGGADEAAILTNGSLPIIGGGWGCGQYNQGFPSCALSNPDQQCCAHDIRPPNLGPGGGVFDLSGQTITIAVSPIRGNGTYFIEWLGMCRPAPAPCVPSPSAPWCQGGLDFRNPPNFTCTVTLPSDHDVQVITHWESNPSDNLPTCTQDQVLSGTCAAISSTTTSTTTTLPFDQLPQFKQDAARQLKQQLQQSFYPCLVATTGLTVFLVPIPGALAVSVITGTTMLTAGTYACAPHVQTIVHLWKVFKDPPDPAFRRIAHVQSAAKPSLDLPACAGLKGKDRTYCRRLEHAATRWAAAVAQVESVAAAFETTANRVGGAHAASDTRAVKKQTRAAHRLAGRFDTADRARAHAGAKLATVLRSAGATGMLTNAQSMQATGIVLGQLAAQGFGNDEAQALFGPALTPGALDLLQVLGQP